MPNDNIQWTKSGSGMHGNPDMRADVPEYGHPQPVLDTDTSGAEPSTIQFPEKRGANPYQEGTADFMPTGGTIPDNSTDVEDQNDGRRRE